MTSFQLAGFRIFKLCFVDSFNPETQISHQQLNSVSWVEEVCQIWGRCCARGLDNERTLVGQKRLNSWAAYLYQRPDPIVGAVYLSSHWNHYFIALTSLVLHIAHKPDVYFRSYINNDKSVFSMSIYIGSRSDYCLALSKTGSLSQCLKLMLLMLSVMRLMMVINAIVVVNHFKVRAHVIVFRLFIDVL